MTKEKQAGTAEPRQGTEKRDWIKFLRGQGTTLTPAAATVATETDKAMVADPSESVRKTEAAMQTVEGLPPLNGHSTGPQSDPDIVTIFGVATAPADRRDRPSGIFVPSPICPAPEIARIEKDDWNYEEAKELSDYMHYTLCESYLRECKEAGYGKEDPDYGVKLQLAVAAAGVEISKVTGEALLPSLGGLAKSLQKTEGYVENLNAQKLNDPIIYARAERDGKKLAGDINGDLTKIPASYREIARVAKEMRDIRKMQHDYEKKGQESDELVLNRKVSDMHRHALDYVKDYETKQLRNSIEKGVFGQTAMQKSAVDRPNSGCD